jgi:hypothetical protein
MSVKPFSFTTGGNLSNVSHTSSGDGPAVNGGDDDDHSHVEHHLERLAMLTALPEPVRRRVAAMRKLQV